MEVATVQGPSLHSFSSFSSPEGQAFCSEIASRSLPWQPHTYQLEGACKALDGLDVLAITPTGSGKTGFLLIYILVAQAIAKDPTLCPAPLRKHFRQDPCMVVVCPTKALEHDMEPKFQAAGLTTVVINADTTRAAQARGENLWDKARAGTAVILLSPEELGTPAFRRLMDAPTFAARVMALDVDEVHLLCSWSKFREEFKEIGNVRMRLPGTPVMIALTATLCPGEQTSTVCNFLGLRHHHLIRRSNARNDIKWIFRTMEAGPKSYAFPELDWVISGDRRVVVFCGSITLSQRLFTYLWNKSEGLADRRERVRIFTALGPDTYSRHTLNLLRDVSDTRSRVTFGTDTMAHGLDASTTTDVVSYGFIPEDINIMVQRAGRIRDGRDCDGRSLVYLPRNATQRAEEAIARTADTQTGSRQVQKRKASGSGKESSTVDPLVARVILAQCKVAELNAIFANPEADDQCTCPTCVARPAAPPPVPCTCSGCTPEDETPVEVSTPVSGVTHAGEQEAAGAGNSDAGSGDGSEPPSDMEHEHDEEEQSGSDEREEIRHDDAASSSQHAKKKQRVRGALKITRHMRTLGLERLSAFRRDVWEAGDDTEYSMVHPSMILPDSIVKVLFDNFADAVSTMDALRALIGPARYLADHEDTLFRILQELKGEFEDLQRAKRAAANAKRRATLQAKKGANHSTEKGSSSLVPQATKATLGASGVSSRQSAGRIRIPGGHFFRLNSEQDQPLASENPHPAL